MESDTKPLPETLELIYELTRGGPARQLASADSIDAKAMQVFVAASVVLGLGSLIDLHGIPAVFYGLGLAAYACVASATWKVVRARRFRVVDGGDRWWPSHRLSETNFVREQVLDDIAAAFRGNRSELDSKGKPLDLLLLGAAIEVALVAVAVLTSLA